MAHELYSTKTLLGVMDAMQPVSSYWLDLLYPTEVRFDTEEIDFEKISNHRKLAPLVVPTVQGQPIYTRGSEVLRFKPAYVKPRDTVEPHRMLRRTPGNLFAGGFEGTGAVNRWNAVIGDITRDHRESIERRWEWLAAQAAIYGQVTLSGEAYPERIVDFRRDAGQSVTLSGSATWDGADGNPIADINTWRHQTRRLKFGGTLNRITCGAQALEALLDDEAVQDQMRTDIRGTNVSLNTGVREGLEAEYIGTLGSGLEVWSYQDYYEDENGDAQEIMDPRDVVLTGDIGGVRAFGAILDQKAQLRPLPIFPKMWDAEDPAATYLMSQSAPLMVPTLPNRSLRARVVA